MESIILAPDIPLAKSRELFAGPRLPGINHEQTHVLELPIEIALPYRPKKTTCADIPIPEACTIIAVEGVMNADTGDVQIFFSANSLYTSTLSFHVCYTEKKIHPKIVNPISAEQTFNIPLQYIASGWGPIVMNKKDVDERREFTSIITFTITFSQVQSNVTLPELLLAVASKLELTQQDYVVGMTVSKHSLLKQFERQAATMEESKIRLEKKLEIVQSQLQTVQMMAGSEKDKQSTLVCPICKVNVPNRRYSTCTHCICEHCAQVDMTKIKCGVCRQSNPKGTFFTLHF